MPLLINIVFLHSQSNVHSSSDDNGEQSSETNLFVSDEEQPEENPSVPSDGKEASESSSSPSQEEQPFSPVLSSSPSVVNTHKEGQIQNLPTSDSLHGGIKVSQLFSFE